MTSSPDIPRMVYTDSRGTLYDHPFYRMAIDDGSVMRLPRPDELCALPPGSDAFMLPGRHPVGINPDTMGPETFCGGGAASAFASPAYLRLAHPAFERCEDSRPLPLFAYAPLGYRKGRLYTTAVRVDRSNRQDPRLFDRRAIGSRARALERELPANRLIRHLVRCAMVYGCRAAQNFFLCREEAPLPSSPTCNATCVGCLSHQPPGSFPASHDRIAFTPTPEEIAEVAVLHIGRVARPVVSFGQGCEGEPLAVAGVLAEAIRLIRRHTREGTINLNTNGGDPAAVAGMREAGLDSIRLSVNSFRETAHSAYFRPRGFGIEEVIRSGRVMSDSGGFVSVNLLVFPGISDTEEDLTATIAGLRSCGAGMVQMRNLNIDPDAYRVAVGRPPGAPMGLVEAMKRMREALPGLRFGYFNPHLGKKVRG